MIRFIFVALFLILYLICSVPIFLVEWIIGKISPQARDLSSLRIVQWGFKRILAITGVEVTVIGEENIPDEAVLFIGNHRSYFEDPADLFQMQTADRLCGKERDGKDSSSFYLDAVCLLPLPGSRQPERGPEDHLKSH